MADDRIDKVVTGMGVLEERMTSLCRSMDGFRADLNGNGRPGLHERLCRLEYRAAVIDYWSTIVLRCLVPIALMLMSLGVLVYLRENL